MPSPLPMPQALSLPAPPAAQAAPARNAQPEAGGSGDGFSRAMQRAQERAHEQAQSAEPRAPGQGSGSGSGSDSPRQARRASAETAPVQRPQVQASKLQPLDEVDAESTLPLPEPAQVDGEEVAADPAGIAALLAQWRAAPNSTAAADPRLLPGDAEAGDAGADPSGAKTLQVGAADWNALAAAKAAAQGRPDRSAVDNASAALQGAASTTALAQDKASTAASLAAALASPPQSKAGSAEAAVLPAAAPLSALPAWATGGPAASPAAAQAQLPASPGNAQFAPQLGAQIMSFVRDGIQNARLHLNPAAMGPVSVRIQIDGSQALIHLGADQSATRQALEQAMPMLASSLREAGLTLAGGGVFEQARQGHNPDAQPDRDGQAAGRSPSDPGQTGLGADALALTQPGRRRGVVDLVA